MDPLDYLKVLRRRWWVWVTVLAVALCAGLLTLPRGDDPNAGGPIATSFGATHTLLQAPSVQVPVNLELTRLFTTTGEIPRLAAQTLGRPAEDGPLLASTVEVVVDPDVEALRISVTDADGEKAAATANAFGEAVKEFLRSRADADRAKEVTALQTQIATLQDRILDLERQIAVPSLSSPILTAQQEALTNQYGGTFERLQVLQTQAAASSPLDTLEEAVPIPILATGSPVPTSSRGRLGMAAAIGLLLGVGLALAVDRLDNRVRTRQDVERSTGLPVVAEIPRLGKDHRGSTIVTSASPGSGAAEAYRGLRAAVLLVPSRAVTAEGAEPVPVDLSTWRPPQVLLVTSPSPADGKTSTVVNLAAAMAESGRSVIVIDADFRNPNANRFLGVPRSPGLSDVLNGSVPGGVSAVLQPTGTDGVTLITSGTISRPPGAMLSRLGGVLEEVRTLADVVIIDAAPMLAANDATDIVPHVDSVVLVTHVGRTSGPQAERTVDLLRRLAVPVLGVVVQAAAEADGLGYHTYGADREDPADAAVEDEPAAPAARRGRSDGPAAPRTGTRPPAKSAPAKSTRTFHAKRT